ncbi:hypothetical protein L195_g027748 [Trifolium pratense]|uniref:Uncharacterized protein n=1 Tax=Trifolium pratense TaxID=57577 RepID=A0A2K3L002_TRIPR|nr:hypothetical protein L195_g027748 [Trifolium pratense]
MGGVVRSYFTQEDNEGTQGGAYGQKESSMILGCSLYIIMCSLTFKLMNIAIVIMPSASNKHGWLYYHSVKVLDMIGLKLSALNQIKLSSRA